MSLTLEKANRMLEAAFVKGKEIGLQPLSGAVLDAGGHLLAFQRQDNSSNMRPQIAIGKAAGALSLGVSSRKIGEMAAERPTFIGSLGAVASSGIIPAAGALILTDDSGCTLGAVGITGDISDNDEICAAAGITAVGLVVKN